MKVLEMCARCTMASMLSTRYSAQMATQMVMRTRATPAAMGERVSPSFFSDGAEEESSAATVVSSPEPSDAALAGSSVGPPFAGSSVPLALSSSKSCAWV